MIEENHIGMNEQNLRILVLGSGGREHTLAKICAQSPIVGEVLVAPGNGGIAQEFRTLPISVESNSKIIDAAQAEGIDLVVVGPEIPLCNGVVDQLNQIGIPAYGPDAMCARLEGSKAFTKDFLARHNIPTAEYGNFTEVEPALEYLHNCNLPVVVKASGLAAGKGVIICSSREEAEKEVRDMLSGNSFGESGSEVVIEEFLEGEEASLHLICSGEQYVTLPMSQDHKKVGEGDTGLNTGGMGAYAPTSLVSQSMLAEYEESIVRPTLSGLKKEGMHFQGTLYIGLMLTTNGPKVLEFNVRFGDPETQVILPLVEQDLVPVLLASAKGESLPKSLKFKDEFAMVVVLASEGYPGPYPKGEEITAPSNLPLSTLLIHAGTTSTPEGKVVSSSGRVLGAIGLGKTLQSARDSAYSLCESVQFPSKYYRRDIGHKEFSRS
jgi:phosphoribosylamine--glycine ligase